MFMCTLVETSERFVTAKVGVRFICGDREARATYVVLCEIAESLAILRDPFLVRAGDGAGGASGLPHAKEPNPVESLLSEARKKFIRYVVQSRATA